jgi:hypothetical protein
VLLERKKLFVVSQILESRLKITREVGIIGGIVHDAVNNGGFLSKVKNDVEKFSADKCRSRVGVLPYRVLPLEPLSAALGSAQSCGQTQAAPPSLAWVR